MSTVDWTTLDAERSQIRRWTWIGGASLTCVTAAVVFLFVAWIDYAWRPRDFIPRSLLTLILLASPAAVAWPYWIRPLSFRLSRSDLARAFFGPHSESAAVIAAAESVAASRHSHGHLERRLLDRAQAHVAQFAHRRRVHPAFAIVAFCAALSVAAVGMTAAVAGPSTAYTASLRLLWPWSPVEWPQRVALQYLTAELAPFQLPADEPLRLSTDDRVSLYIENLRGPLPPSVEVEWRDAVADSPPLARRNLPFASLRDSTGAARRLAQLDEIPPTGSTRFRVVAGDDQHRPWISLEIAPPPELTDLRVAVRPPSYTQEPVVELPAGLGHVRAWIGSVVSVSGRSTTRLRRVEVRRPNASAVAASLSEEGRSFHVEFPVVEAGASSYAIHLFDEQGRSPRSAPKFELFGQSDAPPVVVMLLPESDQTVTPEARIDVRWTATDDLHVESMRLGLRMADRPVEHRPVEHRPVASRIIIGSGSISSSAARTWEATETIIPAEYGAKQPGDRLTLVGEAIDHRQPSPQIGRGTPRTLTVVSPESKRQELAVRVGELAESLARTADQISQLAADAAKLREQWNAAGELRSDDKASLDRVTRSQRKLQQQLFDERAGASAQAQRIAAEYRGNWTDSREANQSAEGLDAVAETLDDRVAHLAEAAERALTDARRQSPAEPALEKTSIPAPSNDADTTPASEAKSNSDGRAETPNPLADSRERLDEWARAVRNLAEPWSGWASNRRRLDQLAELEASQRDLQHRTAELAASTAGKNRSEFAPNESTEATRLGLRQRELADRFDRLEREHSRQGDSASPMPADAPSTSQPDADTPSSPHAERLDTLLDQAEAALAERQLGSAVERQGEVVEALRKLQAEAARDASPTSNEAEEETLRKAVDRVDDLANRQNAAAERDQTGEAAAHEQDELAEAAEELADELAQLSKDAAVDALDEAAEQMRSAAQRQRSGESAQSAQRAAGKSLRSASDALSRERRKRQDRLDRQAALDLLAVLPGWSARQKSLRSEADRLAQGHAARGRWQRSELKSIQDLAAQQAGLGEEVAPWTEKLRSPVVVRHLEKLASLQQSVAERIRERNLDATTTANQSSAKRRIDALIEALGSNRTSPPDQTENPAGDPMDSDDAQRHRPDEENSYLLGQLRLLRDWQRELAARSAHLTNPAPPDSTDDPLAAERTAIATEQQELIELAKPLLRDLAGSLQKSPAPAPPATDPSPATKEPNR